MYDVNTGSPSDHTTGSGHKASGDAAPELTDLPDVGVAPVFVVAQFIGLFFRAHADADAQFSSSSSSILGGKISPPPDEALLPPPAVDCMISSLEDTDTAVRHEPCPGSESPCDLPAYATVQAVQSAGPSDASDWVGLQDIYVSAREIFDRYNARDPGGGRVTTHSELPSR